MISDNNLAPAEALAAVLDMVHGLLHKSPERAAQVLASAALNGVSPSAMVKNTLDEATFALLAGIAHAQQYERNDRSRSDDRRYQEEDRCHGEDLQLVCYGQAEKTVAENCSGYQWNPNTHKYETKSELTTGKRDFDSAVNVSIHDNRGRIRIAKDLIPPINSGGSDGWWDIEDLLVGHDEVRGRFRLNGLNRPSLVIDRRNGTITVDGMIKFNGRCDQDSGHRRF